ncbi:phosphopantetheine adenylyltransferase [Labrenzia sp. PHM005]|uniref:phosphopantetheine adenylyltransferase n=1 Tax=Labrenzia sp. PHM005 TaxID=2590016 RepID=UPI0011405A46|nr:phosphopantetheine adenylyltransferase [Labrenzia sp. PHM005]QDG77672.1 phosphopantetheine adenylyltransferase [Labrenzia sp. PHM005]
MRSSHTTNQPFATEAKAMDPFAHVKMASIFVLAVLTVLLAGVFGMNASSASQAQEAGMPAAQGMIASKSDRKSGPDVQDCKNQTWGAWSAKCAAELTGASKVRTVSFVTVEKQPMTVNQTILARYPANN